MPDKATEVSALWRRVSRGVRERLKQAFDGFPLPQMAGVLLHHINLTPGTTVSELARQTNIVKSHVSNMVDHLVSEGYVEKRDDPSDQRLQRLYATAEAESIFKEAEARARAAWVEILEEAPKGQIDEVIRCLQILLKALEKGHP